MLEVIWVNLDLFCVVCRIIGGGLLCISNFMLFFCIESVVGFGWLFCFVVKCIFFFSIFSMLYCLLIEKMIILKLKCEVI